MKRHPETTTKVIVENVNGSLVRTVAKNGFAPDAPSVIRPETGNVHTFQTWKLREGRWVAMGLEEGRTAQEAGEKVSARTGITHVRLTPIGERSIAELGYRSTEVHIADGTRIARKRSQTAKCGPKGRSKISVVTYANGSPFRGS